MKTRAAVGGVEFADCLGSRPAASTAVELRRIVGCHAEFVWRILRRLGVPSAEVEDAAQHVFLVAAEKLSATRIVHERAFLYWTAKNVAMHARRTAARTREVLGEDLSRFESAESPADERLDRQRDRLALDEVLDEMADELREVFVLFEMEELSMVEIASFLRIPAGTVASRLRRAREDFRRRLPRVLSRGTRRGAP